MLSQCFLNWPPPLMTGLQIFPLLLLRQAFFSLLDPYCCQMGSCTILYTSIQRNITQTQHSMAQESLGKQIRGVLPTQSSKVFFLALLLKDYLSLAMRREEEKPRAKASSSFCDVEVDQRQLSIVNDEQSSGIYNSIRERFYYKFRYSLMDNPQEKVKIYIDEMNNYDPDLQEMGAKYLCDLVLSGKLNLLENPQLARTITENFLKQVGSQSFVVHSAAIRFLAEMVPKLPNDQLVHVFTQTITAIARVDTPPERREIFSTAAGTMIHLAPDQLGMTLSKLFIQSIEQLMKSKGENTDIEMLLLNVITQFTRKWPNVAGNKNVKFNREALIQYLLRNIETSKKLLLIRKSDGALSKISIILDKTNLEYLLVSKEVGLLGFIRNYMKTTNEAQMKSLRNGLLSLSNILKTQNHELRKWAKEIVIICTNIIQFYKDKDTYMEVTIEILESAVTCLTYLVKAYSSELGEIFKHQVNELNDFVQEFLNFDLEGMMNYIEEEAEMQEEDYEEEEDYFSDDAVCWKVRAAAVRYTTVLMHKDKCFRDNKVKSEDFLKILSTKLVEENEKVSTSAFECFNYIIESISTSKAVAEDIEDMGLRRVKSTEGDFAMQIVQQISDQIGILFHHKKTKQVTKTEASKILLRIIELLRERIVENEEVCMKLLNQVTNEVGKVKTDSCVNLLKVIKSLVSGIQDFGVVKNILNILLKYTSDTNLKVASISYGGIRSILATFPNEVLKSGEFKKIFDNLLVKLKEHDADRIIKSSVIKCLGPIFENMLSNLSDNEKKTLLESVFNKLKIEIEKSLILNQISQIPEQYVLKNANARLFSDLLELASESLGAANFELNTNAIQCCEKLIFIQKNNLTVKTSENVLNKSRSLLFEGKIPKFIDILLDAHPKAFNNYVELIVRTAENYYISKLLKHKVTNVRMCIQILKGVAKPEVAKKISLILSEIGLDEKSLMKDVGEDQWGIISIGAIGYVGNEKSIDYITKLIHEGKSEEVKFEASRALGNIASRHPKLVFAMMEQAEKVQDPYPFIFAIKEMLEFKKQEFPGIEDVIKWLFTKAQKNDRESNHYVISESIGIIARFSSNEARKIIKSVHEMSPIRRFIVASSLRYMLEGTDESTIEDESVEDYCHGVAELTKDKEVNIRYGAMKSLNSIVNSHYPLIKGCLTEKFIDKLKENLSINSDLIIIVDYGVNKEKKDLGRPLRTESFNFLKAVLENRKIQAIYEQLVKKCLERITQQSSNDLILKRVSIIKKICEKDFTAFIPLQHDFTVLIGVEEGVLKSQTQKSADDDRNEAYLKGLLKEIVQIKNLSEQQNSDKIKAMVNSIKSIPKFNKIIQTFESN